MFRKPAPSTAKNRKTRPIDGTARPTFATVTATNEPAPACGRATARRQADAIATAIAAPASSSCLTASGIELAAADLGAAGALALVQDEVDRVAERAQEGERAGHAARPASRAS